MEIPTCNTSTSSTLNYFLTHPQTCLCFHHCPATFLTVTNVLCVAKHVVLSLKTLVPPGICKSPDPCFPSTSLSSFFFSVFFAASLSSSPCLNSARQAWDPVWALLSSLPAFSLLLISSYLETYKTASRLMIPICSAQTCPWGSRLGDPCVAGISNEHMRCEIAPPPHIYLCSSVFYLSKQHCYPSICSA